MQVASAFTTQDFGLETERLDVFLLRILSVRDR